MCATVLRHPLSSKLLRRDVNTPRPVRDFHCAGRRTSRAQLRLPKEAQACLAGDMQRVAKLMAVKADYEVIRELAKLEPPDQTGQDWDER